MIINNNLKNDKSDLTYSVVICIVQCIIDLVNFFDFPHLPEFFPLRVVPAPDWPVKRFCKKGAKNKL